MICVRPGGGLNYLFLRYDMNHVCASSIISIYDTSYNHSMTVDLFTNIPCPLERQVARVLLSYSAGNIFVSVVGI